MTEEQRLDVRLDLIPREPGVYLMKDASGSVIYVGKAKDLRQRLSSYFKSRPEGTAKTLALISRIAGFDYFVTPSELEAWMLEANFIKEHQPHYNVLLRDDREYPYIRVTLQETYPRVMKAFHIGPDEKEGARYFGPYLSGDLYFALKALHEIFPLKTCKRVFPRDIGKERPCLNYYIGRCIGPCQGDVPASAYRAVVDDVVRFLEGRYRPLLADLRRKMARASDELRFEDAARWRDRTLALERLMAHQHVAGQDRTDRDVLGLAHNEEEVCLVRLEVREGRVNQLAPFFFARDEAGDEALLVSFLTQHYGNRSQLPKEILLPLALLDRDTVQAFLQKRTGRALRLHTPQRGEKKRLVELAAENAAEQLRKHTLLGGSSQTRLDLTLKTLARLTGEERPLSRIEAYDISSTGQDDWAASLVVFREGRPERKSYRHFKVQNKGGDVGALRDVVQRRLARHGDERFAVLPDLILLDGGKAQIGAVRDLLQETGIPVAGIVKDQRHRTRGLVLADGKTIELSGVTSDREEALALWRLLTAIQNEAHRFAGRLNKQLMKTRQTRWSLEAIPGVGPVRRKKLLEHFPSLEAIRQAGLDELLSVPGLDRRTAENIRRHFEETDRP